MGTDIVIIGAGFSGLNLAHALSKSSPNLSITLIDRAENYPDNFRADKLEADQSRLMREIGTFEYRRPNTKPIGDIIEYRDDSKTRIDTEEQYGLNYSVTVNLLRQKLPNSISILQDTVVDIKLTSKGREIHCANRKPLNARLVVICTGGNGKLPSLLGMKRYQSKRLRSLSFGFDIRKKDGGNIRFENDLAGVNFYHSKGRDTISYLTIFPIGDRIRCNLFSQLKPNDPVVKQIRADIFGKLQDYFPNFREIMGEIDLASKVEIMPTQLYRLTNYKTGGIVVVGDEFQSVNPETGTGLSKILTEVKLLALHYIPTWFKNQDFSRHAINKFYTDKQKLCSDLNSLSIWIYFYKLAYKNNSFLMKLKETAIDNKFYSIIKYL